MQRDNEAASTKQVYDFQFHEQGLAQNVMCNILFTDNLHEW